MLNVTQGNTHTHIYICTCEYLFFVFMTDFCHKYSRKLIKIIYKLNIPNNI